MTPISGLILLVVFFSTAHEGVCAGDGLNPDAAKTVLYELQVQSANACDPEVGTPEQQRACRQKIAPPYDRFNYTARHGRTRRDCAEIGILERIKLGTFDDLLEETDDFRKGITLTYVRNRVGPVMIWLQPPFPHNERNVVPHECDNTGSPYAVRDYMHAQGKLSRACIREGRDEYSSEDGKGDACWGTSALDAVIRKSKTLGLTVMLDVAFNHFGHDYNFYDYESFVPVRDRIQLAQDLGYLENFDKTFEEDLLYPKIIDTEAALRGASHRNVETANAVAIRRSLQELEAHCKAQSIHLSGNALVRAFGMWRIMLDEERARFSCRGPLYLEAGASGFYFGGWNGNTPRFAHRDGDFYRDPEWPDVKFLFLHKFDRNVGGLEYQIFMRNQEYLFRILNYWVSRGIEGFRLDHTTDGRSGISPVFWRYAINKVNYYAKKRWERQGRPGGSFKPVIFMAEDFDDNHKQQEMAGIVDALTEGYIGMMRGGPIRDTFHVENALRSSDRFGHRAFVLRALEDHDESRLFESFKRNAADEGDPWVGAGFWAIGASSPGMPSLLVGQEFGEKNRLAFKKSHYLESRFRPRDDAWALIEFYGSLVRARTNSLNRALFSWNTGFLRTKNNNGAVDPNIFAQARWSNGGANVVFTFNNLWQGMSDQHFFIPPNLAAMMSIEDRRRYRLVNILDGTSVRDCITGADLKWDFGVAFPLRKGSGDLFPIAADNQSPGNWRVQWLRLELCD